MLMCLFGYRLLLFMLCSGVAAAAAAPVGLAAEKAVLVIGGDATDIRTIDPARAAEMTPPLILRAVYDTLCNAPHLASCGYGSGVAEMLGLDAFGAR